MTIFAKSLLVTATAFATFTSQALTLGVTEGLTYRATDAEIEAQFAPLPQPSVWP